MLKKSCCWLLSVLFLLLVMGRPSYCEIGKLTWGIGMTIAGLFVAAEGFQVVDKQETQSITLDVPYTWTEEVPDQEWDFMYNLWSYDVTNEVTVYDTYYIDPNPSSIKYTWALYDAVMVGSVMYLNTSFRNHHITYKTVSHSGTTKVTDDVTITRKEYNNINQGIGGICLLSAGINQIITYIQEENEAKKHSKAKFKPELKFAALPGKLSLTAGVRF